jgi:hypothetical protein
MLVCQNNLFLTDTDELVIHLINKKQIILELLYLYSVASIINHAHYNIFVASIITDTDDSIVFSHHSEQLRCA